MRYIWQHIRIIIDSYTGTVPLAHYLKNYFKQHPKLGSRDRKLLGNMAYSWYRCAKGIVLKGADDNFENMLHGCMQLCNIEYNHLLFGDAHISEFLFDANKLFPYPVNLSMGIEKSEWLQSMLQQPYLFIRIRKEKEKIINILNNNKIPFTFLDSACMSLPNGAKIDTLLPPDAYVVQDASSQKTATYFKPQKQERWYDCCAGAGGKSLLLKDINSSVRLTVSDMRESILHNLHDRFRLYHHVQPVARLTNVTDKAELSKTLQGQTFDNIICDAPCSGSGTWARTPEQLYFFKPETLQKFTQLQQDIATNVAQFLKPGGKLFYITCSVFENENEDVIREIIRNTALALMESKLINGISIKADSMYIAVLNNV